MLVPLNIPVSAQTLNVRERANGVERFGVVVVIRPGLDKAPKHSGWLPRTVPTRIILAQIPAEIVVSVVRREIDIDAARTERAPEKCRNQTAPHCRISFGYFRLG